MVYSSSVLHPIHLILDRGATLASSHRHLLCRNASDGFVLPSLRYGLLESHGTCVLLFVNSNRGAWEDVVEALLHGNRAAVERALRATAHHA